MVGIKIRSLSTSQQCQKHIFAPPSRILGRGALWCSAYERVLSWRYTHKRGSHQTDVKNGWNHSIWGRKPNRQRNLWGGGKISFISFLYPKWTPQLVLLDDGVSFKGMHTVNKKLLLVSCWSVYNEKHRMLRLDLFFGLTKKVTRIGLDKPQDFEGWVAWEEFTTYEVKNMIIFLGYRIPDFTGNLHTQKINKSHTNKANIICVQYNSRGSTGSGVNFVLSFLLLSLCDNYHISPLYMASVVCLHSHDPPLQYHIW